MKSLSKLKNKSPQTESLLKHVQKAIHSVAPGAEIILYGSRARGDANPLSDWDFLVLLDRPKDNRLEARIKDLLYDLELETNTVLSSIIRSRKEWLSPKYSVMPFKKEIDKEGVPI